MFQFPFGTMHQLNLDWFLQQWQQLRQDWIDEEQHIDESMQDVYDARDAAIQAKDDAVSAKNDAQTAKASADADALIAEGFALGEQNGTPVGAGSPYYQANAKFYSTTAGTYRYLSEAYARGTMGGTPVDPGDAGYEDNAKYYKDAAAASAQDASDDADYVRDHVTDADASALEAEGFAVGEQGGTPVASGSPYYENNAKYYAGEAQQDKLDTDTLKDAANAAALRSEGWAVGEQNGTPVGPGSPYYENNAEYYAQQASAINQYLITELVSGDSVYIKDGMNNKAIKSYQFDNAATKLIRNTKNLFNYSLITDTVSVIKNNTYGVTLPAASGVRVMSPRIGTLAPCLKANKTYYFYCVTDNAASKRLYLRGSGRSWDSGSSITILASDINSDCYLYGDPNVAVDINYMLISEEPIENYDSTKFSAYTEEVYTLTNGVPDRDITTAYGINTFSVDTGVMDLEYYADIKLYIDTQISNLQALVLENI